MPDKSLLSALTIAAVGLGSKVFLRYFCSDVKVIGRSHLLDALERPRFHHKKAKGILTVSNHISVLDDPLMWGILPTTHYTHARPIRWSLGASDICFTNPLFAAFFTQGQVLETVRGRGVKQPAVDTAIELLNAGEWVHIFPEGQIAQPSRSKLSRLKWGRILMEVKETPMIIPMWLTGFDSIMPEPRGFPRFIPRPGKVVGITFGESSLVEQRIDAYLNRLVRPKSGALTSLEEADFRAGLTFIIQQELEKIGRQVSGEV